MDYTLTNVHDQGPCSPKSLTRRLRDRHEHSNMGPQDASTVCHCAKCNAEDGGRGRGGGHSSGSFETRHHHGALLAVNDAAGRCYRLLSGREYRPFVDQVLVPAILDHERGTKPLTNPES